MILKREVALSFDDVVLQPEYSEIKRGEADVTPRPFKNIAPKIPIISSPMSSVTEGPMLLAMQRIGGLGIHHRYCNIDDVIKNLYAWPLFEAWNPMHIPLAVGSIPSHQDTIDKLLNVGHKFFCVDVANGAHINALETILYIRQRCVDADIMSGNVATAEQAKHCILAGANILRLSIGSGSVCSTRVVTGCGMPALQTIIEISEILKNPSSEEEERLFPQIILVQDGGIRSSGDLAKTLAAGCDYVILGRLLAGTRESAGKVIMDFRRNDIITEFGVDKTGEIIDHEMTLVDNGGKNTCNLRKIYMGMASKTALVEQNGKDPAHLHIEGVETTVPYVGQVEKVITQLVNGLKQALFYTGSKNLEELQDVTLRVVSNNGLAEGYPKNG